MKLHALFFAGLICASTSYAQTAAPGALVGGSAAATVTAPAPPAPPQPAPAALVGGSAVRAAPSIQAVATPPPPPVVAGAVPASPAMMAIPAAPATPSADHPNRIVLWGGIGPDGLTVYPQNNTNVVKPYIGPLLGVSYAHRVWDRFSINAQLITGASFSSATYMWLGGVGYDF